MLNPATFPTHAQGWASLTLPPTGEAPSPANMEPLLDLILKHVEPPRVDVDAPFVMCVAMIERDPYIGRIATGEMRYQMHVPHVTCGLIILFQHYPGISHLLSMCFSLVPVLLCVQSHVWHGLFCTAKDEWHDNTCRLHHRRPAGRIASGRVAVGDKVRVLSHDGSPPQSGVITKIMKRAGTASIFLDEAIAGDVVSIAGECTQRRGALCC